MKIYDLTIEEAHLEAQRLVDANIVWTEDGKGKLDGKKRE